MEATKICSLGTRRAGWALGPCGCRYTDPMADDGDDPGVLRAGHAFAARRQEIGLSQRQLARQKIITQANLISFEKGRSWPREKTRARLEQVARWPPGTLAKLRGSVGAPESAAIGIPGSANIEVGGHAAIPAIGNGAIETSPRLETAALVTRAVSVAVNQVLATSEKLPGDEEPGFAEAAGAVLADLRELEAIAARAVRSSQGAPEVIKALRLIRTSYDDLMTRAAAAAGATLGQRLYTARNRAALSAAEAADILGVTPDVVTAAEREQPVSRAEAARIEALITGLNEA